MKRSLAVLVALAATLALAVFTGAALAGGHDGGAPGNSGNAPGHSDSQPSQQQSQEPQQSQPTSQQQQQSAQEPARQSTPPGQAKKEAAARPAAHAASTSGSTSHGSAARASSQSSASSLPGIKPSNTTLGHKNATETADSGKTKKYGNGNTAGNIAMSRGAPASTPLYGPGNSQPHKVCRNGHWVDVHAVKSYSATTCSGSQAPQKEQPTATKTEKTESDCSSVKTVESSTQVVGVAHGIGPKGSGRTVLIHPSPNSVHYQDKHPDQVVSATVTKTTVVPTGANCGSEQEQLQQSATQQTQQQSQQTQQQTQQTQGVLSQGGVAAAGSTGRTAAAPTQGVLGAQATLRPSGHGVLGAQATLRPRPHSGGVLGTIRSTTLPFTGLPLWPVVLGALALIGAGAAVRRAQHGRV